MRLTCNQEVGSSNLSDGTINNNKEPAITQEHFSGSLWHSERVLQGAFCFGEYVELCEILRKACQGREDEHITVVCDATTSEFGMFKREAGAGFSQWLDEKSNNTYTQVPSNLFENAHSLYCNLLVFYETPMHPKGLFRARLVGGNSPQDMCISIAKTNNGVSIRKWSTDEYYLKE